MKKRKILSAILVVTMITIAGVGCGKNIKNQAIEENNNIKETKQSILLAKDAVLTGQGYNQEGELKDTIFDDKLNAISYFGVESIAQYTVSEDVDGEYDVYIQLSKTPWGAGSTPVSISINDGKEYVTPVGIVGCLEDFSDLNEMGTFLLSEKVFLKTGDIITIGGKVGFEGTYNNKMNSFMPIIGDLNLYPTGSDVSVGYGEKNIRAKKEKDESDILSGINIVWLGSSVTYGSRSGGYSMADFIEENHADTNSYKYSISGTTLVNENDSSYVARVKDIDVNMDIDLFVVQLSTNDATAGKKLGTLSDSKNLSSFDDTTIIGAMESIIAYVSETWDCPVVFYTGTNFDSKEYEEMVDALKMVQDKWEIDVIDLWNNEKMTAIYGTDQYKKYMADDIHPNKEGYEKWWTPEFEKGFIEILSNK